MSQASWPHHVENSISLLSELDPGKFPLVGLSNTSG